MADRKNEQERDELFRRIYKIATDLVHAGHVAEWDFKSYVLGTMFYRYISENFAAYIDKGEHEAGNHDFSYAKLPDDEAETAREDLVLVKGFFILPSELFCNVLARADKDENLNETLERVFNHIESSAASGEAESDFAGLFDDFDVNSKAIGETVAKRNKVLVELLNGVAQMPLFSTDGINPDLFGDAYEYLMGMYAANAGKKGGQYFTPADVSELLARLGTIGKTSINKVYDPACGSGSLLLKVAKVLGRENIDHGFYGQEIDLTTYNLCRINMFLHNITPDKFSIVREDTLLSPQHWDDQPFELIVSNPPFSVPWEGDKNPLAHQRPALCPCRCAGSGFQGGYGVHYAQPFVAGEQRRGGYRLLPRHYVPRRRRAENPQISGGQQLRGRHHSAALEPVPECDDFRGHYAAEKEQAGQRGSVRGCVEGVCEGHEEQPPFR